MEQPYISVTLDEFQRAATVWLRLAPQSIERRYVKMLKLKEQSRQLPEDMVDLPREYAMLVRAGLEQAGWEITRKQPITPGSPPPPRRPVQG